MQRAGQAETTMESCAPQSKVAVSLRFEGLNCARSGHELCLRSSRFVAGRRLAASGELARNADLAQLGSPPERNSRTELGTPKAPLAAHHQAFKNHPLSVDTHFRVVHFDAVGHKEG